LEPKFLPGIKPTEFNYPIDILGKWRGGNYSFIVRFRSGFPENKARNSILASRASTTRPKAQKRDLM
jgi:hypothetical protein